MRKPTKKKNEGIEKNHTIIIIIPTKKKMRIQYRAILWTQREELRTNDWKPGTALRTRFIDHRFPDTFGLENEFNGFTDRAVTTAGARRVVRGLFYLRGSITHGNG
jgi:hypothetical protein